MPVGTLSAVLVLALELGLGASTAFPLANGEMRARFQAMADPAAEQPPKSQAVWLVLFLSAMMLPGLALVAVWRFARAGSPRSWRPGTLSVLWVAAGGAALALACLGGIFLLLPAALAAWHLLGWLHLAAAALLLVFPLAATLLRLGGRGRARV
jgi:hypothetical protein